MSNSTKKPDMSMKNVFHYCTGDLYSNGKLTIWEGLFTTDYGVLKGVFQRKVGMGIEGNVWGFCLN